MGEAFIEEKLMDLVKEQSNPTLAMYARPGFVEVRLTARADREDQARALLAPLEGEVRRRLAGQIVSFDDDTMAHVLGQIVRDGGYSVSAAESCTGGLVGSLITDVPGASDYFRGSAGTYCNEMKEKILGVSHDTLERYTAVSAQTAAEMAEGSRRLYGTDLAVSTTGIAGPRRRYAGPARRPGLYGYQRSLGDRDPPQRLSRRPGRSQTAGCPAGRLLLSPLYSDTYKESIVRRRQFGRKTDST